MLLYRLLLTLAAPFLILWFGIRQLRGRETGSDIRQRLGLDGPPAPPDAPVLWLHGASNGELTSAHGLIEALLARDATLRILVTSNSLTGRDMVRSWNLPRLHARLAPLDYRACLRPFLDSHAPNAFLLLEGDLWPNRFAMLRERGLPISIVSARISKKSFGTWSRLGPLPRRMMQATSLLSAQDSGSEERFRALGLPETALAPRLTLKSSVLLKRPAPEDLAPFQAVFDRAETLLVASTHEGEEAQAIEAFAIAREGRPALKMILAPRHPKRSAEVVDLLRQSNFTFRTRSAGDLPDDDTVIYLADTLGEMPIWYALSGQCFVGGSLVDKGGHTPFEPAQFDCAILHGPYLSNFAEQYTALETAGGSVRAENATALGNAIAELDAPACARLAVAAREALELESGDDLDALIAALPPVQTPA